MQVLDVVISLAAFGGLCTFLTVMCGLSGALSPLAGMGLISLLFTMAGMADCLPFCGWATLLLGMLLGGVSLVRFHTSDIQQRDQLKKRLLAPGAFFFWGLTLAFLVYFAIRQPLFSDFDEFSFWGTAAKLTKVNDLLYTQCEVGWAWQATQSPGLITLGYYFSFLGRFAPWKVYFAYDALLFSCFAAVIGDHNGKDYRFYLPLGAILWCLPWFFTTYCRTIFVSGVYMTSYGDIPAGVVLGGAVAFWFWARKASSTGARWLLLPVLALAGNIKSNTFVLSLVAAGVVAADCLLFADGRFTKGLPKRLAFSASCFVSPLALYLVWNRYIAGLVAQNAAAGGMGETSESVVTVAISGVRILLGLPVGEYYNQRLPRFAQASGDMLHAFLSREEGKITAVGSGLFTVALIVLVFAAAFVLAKGAVQKARVVLAAALSTGGFVAYNFMLALSYAFIFKPFQCENLEDYNRYVYTYYLFWFLLALTLLSLALQETRLPLLGGSGTLVLALLVVVRTSQLVLPQFSVLGFSDATFDDQRLHQAKADAVAEAVEPNARIFLVSQGEDGKTWFEYSYELLPLILDYSGDITLGGGGGTFGLPGLQPDRDENYNGWLYYHEYTAEQWKQQVQKSGCRYLFINELDEIFLQSYASLFSDGLQAAREGTTLLYAVQPDGPFTPVAMEVPQ